MQTLVKKEIVCPNHTRVTMHFNVLKYLLTKKVMLKTIFTIKWWCGFMYSPIREGKEVECIILTYISWIMLWSSLFIRTLQSEHG